MAMFMVMLLIVLVVIDVLAGDGVVLVSEVGGGQSGHHAVFEQLSAFCRWWSSTSCRPDGRHACDGKDLYCEGGVSDVVPQFSSAPTQCCGAGPTLTGSGSGSWLREKNLQHKFKDKKFSFEK